jgi:hypothetical protein
VVALLDQTWWKLGGDGDWARNEGWTTKDDAFLTCVWVAWLFVWDRFCADRVGLDRVIGHSLYELAGSS